MDVNYRTRKNIDDAIRKCGYGKASAGKVIAELSFGFWRQLTTNAMEKSMWVPYLHTAFPQGTSRRSIDAQVSAVNELRNRIAHHEPLFGPTVDPESVCGEMMDCLLLVAPSVHTYVQRTSTVDGALAARP
ncbi:hypothetical protein [Brevibacterium spongiae]|uniref:Abi-like protein n=1 Tax=Brevibacterium spongiae TaxID=2909672 RepID=A0ABY5SLY9_9MICO|nr:hypothetical protein [Brevibacterium spongiae]UVI35565.1 hypothetical protein L1F31_15805 [Brevibacterium spongiae]